LLVRGDGVPIVSSATHPWDDGRTMLTSRRFLTRWLSTMVVFAALSPGFLLATATPSANESRSTQSATQVVQRCTDYRVAPRHYIVVACGDGNIWLNDLHWRYWHRFDARGHGYLVTNDCNPTCAEGHFHRYPAGFHLTRARTDHHHFVFHHVSTRFTGKRPAYARSYREMQLVGYPVG
jgi:hypothetical protein